MLGQVRFGIITILVAIIAAGCSDENKGGAASADSAAFGGFADTAASPDGGKDRVTPPQLALEIIVLHDTTIPLQLGIQDNLTIRAKVIDYSRDLPGIVFQYPCYGSAVGRQLVFTLNVCPAVQTVARDGAALDSALAVRITLRPQAASVSK